MLTPRYAPSKVYEPESPENVRLRRLFEIAHPGVVSGKVFEDGKRAAIEGAAIEACPWLESPEWAAWRNGWHTGRAEMTAPRVAA